MLQNIIFDLDGTIIDTILDIQASVNLTLRQYGFQEITLEEATAFVGKGTDHLLNSSLKKSSPINLDYPKFKEVYMVNQNALTPTYSKAYPKMEAALKKLIKLGFNLYVFSNKPHHLAVLVVETIFPHLFIDIVGHHFSELPKPDTTAVKKLLVRHQLKIEESIWIGDSVYDILTAKNLAMSSIAVTWGYQNRTLLETANPDYFVNTVSELISLLTNLQGKKS